MQQPALTLQTQVQAETAVLTVSGRLGRPAAAQVRATLLDQLQNRPKRLLVDLTHVLDIDEAGLGTLLIVSLWARKFATEFALIPSQTLRDRLTTARLDRYFTPMEAGLT
jgi:anti-anti-sigma factor